MPSSFSLEAQLQAAQNLISRLERLSADSFWAHQASGLRGALLRWVAACESGEALSPQAQARLESLLARGYYILGKAARETLRGRSSLNQARRTTGKS